MARTSKRAPPGDATPGDGADGPEAGIDGVLDGLERLVSELEAGDLPLEKALERFEHGVKLARKGGAMLDAVEERVEMLLAERDEVIPFASGDAGEGSQEEDADEGSREEKK